MIRLFWNNINFYYPNNYIRNVILSDDFQNSPAINSIAKIIQQKKFSVIIKIVEDKKWSSSRVSFEDKTIILQIKIPAVFQDLIIPISDGKTVTSQKVTALHILEHEIYHQESELYALSTFWTPNKIPNKMFLILDITQKIRNFKPSLLDFQSKLFKPSTITQLESVLNDFSERKLIHILISFIHRDLVLTSFGSNFETQLRTKDAGFISRLISAWNGHIFHEMLVILELRQLSPHLKDTYRVGHIYWQDFEKLSSNQLLIQPLLFPIDFILKNLKKI